jgi:hypothetical protein
MIAALLIAVYAQFLLPIASATTVGLLLYVLAIICFGLGIRQRDRVWCRADDVAPVSSEAGVAAWERPRSFPSLAIVSGCMAVAAFALFGGNRFTGLNVTLWLAAVLYFIAAFVQGDLRAWLKRVVADLAARKLMLPISVTIVGLLAVLLVGAFFRFYLIGDIPYEMTSDHAEKLLDVNDVLHGEYRIFFPRNTGREALQFYLAALTATVTGSGVSHLTLKLGTAFFGMVAIPFTYLLAREMYDELAGFIASALLATSFWHVAIARVGLRFPFTSAFAAPTLYFLYRALKYNRRNDWIAAGLFMGIGLQTYTAFRIVPLIVAVLVVARLIQVLLRPGGGIARPWTSVFVVNSALCAGAATLAFLPSLRYMLDQPNSFWYRSATRVTGDSLNEPTAAAAIHGFAVNVWSALLMFNYRGDVVWVNTIPNRPVLDTVTGALFALGVVTVLWWLLRWHDLRGAFLLFCVFGLLLPSVLAVSFPIENPAVNRTGGAPPFVMIIAAVPLAMLVRVLWRAATTRSRIAAAGVVAFVLVVASQLNYNMYFVEYDQQYRLNARNSREIGAVVRGAAGAITDFDHIWVVTYPHWVDTRNVGINAGNADWSHSIDGPDQLNSLRDDKSSMLFLVNPEDADDLRTLRSLFPTGLLQRHVSATPGKDFYSYLVPER